MSLRKKDDWDEALEEAELNKLRRGQRDWNPTKYTCPTCQDVVWSRYPGEFRWCKGQHMAVDQTRHYTRFIGELPVEYKTEYPDESSVVL